MVVVQAFNKVNIVAEVELKSTYNLKGELGGLYFRLTINLYSLPQAAWCCLFSCPLVCEPSRCFLNLESMLEQK
jgi:hypothetical protein